MDAALKTMCKSTVTIAPWTGQDVYGQASYGTAVSYAAHISGKARMVRNAAGQEVVSSVHVVLSTAPTVSTKDRITLPSGYVPQTPPILAVSRPFSEAAVSHTSIYLQ